MVNRAETAVRLGQVRSGGQVRPENPAWSGQGLNRLRTGQGQVRSGQEQVRPGQGSGQGQVRSVAQVTRSGQ
jgi:hypothetical protein